MMRLLAPLVVGACATQAPCPPLFPASTPRRAFLWQVSSPHGSLVLFGTHQAAGKDDVRADAWTYLDRSDLFVAEAEAYRVGVTTRSSTAEKPEQTLAIDTRNEVWARKLILVMESGKHAFVAIGVSNITGPRGLAERLTAAGYTVTRL